MPPETQPRIPPPSKEVLDNLAKAEVGILSQALSRLAVAVSQNKPDDAAHWAGVVSDLHKSLANPLIGSSLYG